MNGGVKEGKPTKGLHKLPQFDSRCGILRGKYSLFNSLAEFLD